MKGTLRSRAASASIIVGAAAGTGSPALSGAMPARISAAKQYRQLIPRVLVTVDCEL